MRFLSDGEVDGCVRNDGNPPEQGVPCGSENSMTPGNGGLERALRREDVAKVAELARLSLSDDELDMFTEQLGQIFQHANDIAVLQLDGAVPTARPFGLIKVVREDVIDPSLAREELLAMASDVEDGRFAVPCVMGEAP